MEMFYGGQELFVVINKQGIVLQIFIVRVLNMLGTSLYLRIYIGHANIITVQAEHILLCDHKINLIFEEN